MLSVDIYAPSHSRVGKHIFRLLRYALRVKNKIILPGARITQARLGRPVVIQDPVVSTPEDVTQEVLEAEGGLPEALKEGAHLRSVLHAHSFGEAVVREQRLRARVGDCQHLHPARPQPRGGRDVAAGDERRQPVRLPAVLPALVALRLRSPGRVVVGYGDAVEKLVSEMGICHLALIYLPVLSIY